MNQSWTVLQVTSQRIDLERGLEHKSVPCPKDAEGKQIFMGIRPGELIDDGTLRAFLGVKD